MNNNHKIYLIGLFIFYIVFLFIIYKYSCCSKYRNNAITTEHFSELSYIYLKITSKPESFYVKFYNKKYNNYMNLKWNLNNNKFLLLDHENKIIGKVLSEIYNKYIIETTIYPQTQLHIELYNNYENVKMNKESSNDIFYIKKNKIYLHALHIGKINEDLSNNPIKIIVYKEYKEYLNLFALAYIIRKRALHQ